MYFFCLLRSMLYSHGHGENVALLPEETCCSSDSSYHALPFGQIYTISAEGKSEMTGYILFGSEEINVQPKENTDSLMQGEQGVFLCQKVILGKGKYYV